MAGEVSYLNDLDVRKANQHHLNFRGAWCEPRKLQGRTTEDDNLFRIGNDFPLNLKPPVDTEFITSLFAITQGFPYRESPNLYQNGSRSVFHCSLIHTSQCATR
jgi:hypothetical protein